MPWGRVDVKGKNLEATQRGSRAQSGPEGKGDHEPEESKTQSKAKDSNV